jgi:hypothetical protein
MTPIMAMSTNDSAKPAAIFFPNVHEKFILMSPLSAGVG